MNPEQLTPALLASALLSILLEWIPPFRAWFEALTSARKAGIVGTFVFLLSLLSVYGACNWWGTVCPENWWATLGELVSVWVISLAGGQGVHLLTKRQVLRGKSRVARQA